MRYYLYNNDQPTGPFEVSELLQNGLTAESQVCVEDTEEWALATDVPEVAALLQQPAAPQPVEEMDFMTATKKCFQNFANFEGRARRAEFWWFELAHLIIAMLTCGIGSFVCLIPFYAVAVRRLHDIGKSTMHILVTFIPFVGGFILLYWALQDSQPGENEFGPNPKGL